MKLTKALSIALLSGTLSLIIGSPKALAHRTCEPNAYIDCHQSSDNQEQIDYWTNYFFKLVRPEMRHKRVRAYQTLHRRELTEIRRVVANVIDRSCQQPHLNRYYSLAEREREVGLNQQTPRRRFVPRGIRLHHYPNHRTALHGLSEAEVLREVEALRKSELLRDRYDDWDNADYYETEFSDRLSSWDADLWTENYSWQRAEGHFFNNLYRDLANAVFQARHPELNRNLNIKDNLNWATEWTFIRQYFASYEEDRFLKQHFIPVCNSEVFN